MDMLSSHKSGWVCIGKAFAIRAHKRLKSFRQKMLLWFCLNLQQSSTQLLSHSFPLPSGMGRRIKEKGKNSWVGMRTV